MRSASEQPRVAGWCLIACLSQGMSLTALIRLRRLHKSQAVDVLSPHSSSVPRSDLHVAFAGKSIQTWAKSVQPPFKLSLLLRPVMRPARVKLRPFEPPAAHPKRIWFQQGVRAEIPVVHQHLIRSHAVVQRVGAVPVLKISGKSRSADTHGKNRIADSTAPRAGCYACA